MKLKSKTQIFRDFFNYIKQYYAEEANKITIQDKSP